MNELRPHRLDLPRAQLLVVDIQQKLLPLIHNHESVLAQSERMVKAAAALGLPVTISEQYVRGLGPTLPSITAAAADAPHTEKMTFSYCQDPACRERLLSLDRRRHVLLIGIETHVCVLQTALDLLDMQHTPYILADAVGSRRELDYRMALDRLRHAGAIVTTVESVIFELVRESGTDLFKRILPIVK